MFENILEILLKQEFAESHETFLFIIKISFETFIIVLFAEVIPKLYATQNHYKVSKYTIQTLATLINSFAPLIKKSLLSLQIFRKRLEGVRNIVTAKDIDEAIDITNSLDKNDSDRNDTKILKSIVKFGNIAVTQIMRSRMDVVAVDKDATFEELLNTVSESGYSRIPVVEDNFDKVVGIIYAKDLLNYIDADKNFQWLQLIKQAFFVPETKKIDDLLEDFQTKRVHMAIVVDEYGGSSGIVTLEDVLEEVIGDIKDEFDDASEIDYKKIDNYNFIFEGRTALKRCLQGIGNSRKFL
ncbi:MAG: CBS domain-containing protein [Sphingobacteriales bacterium]|nr:CBS domain-containing protein [Sphingobacteriales bacterium]